METVERVIKVIHEQFGIDTDKLFPEATIESLSLDSLDRVELAMGLEEEFGVEMSDDQARHVDTIQGFADLVVQLQSNLNRQNTSGVVQS